MLFVTGNCRRPVQFHLLYTTTIDDCVARDGRGSVCGEGILIDHPPPVGA